jgi:hypothetical protein
LAVLRSRIRDRSSRKPATLSTVELPVAAAPPGHRGSHPSMPSAPFPLPNGDRQTPPSTSSARPGRRARGRARLGRALRRLGARAGDPQGLRERLARVRDLVRRARPAAAAGNAGDRRRVPGRRGRPRVPLGRSRAAPRRSPPRTAPRTTPTHATRPPSRRSSPGSAAQTRPRPAKSTRSRWARSRSCSSRLQPTPSSACATERCCCSDSPQRCAAPSSSRSTSRTCASTSSAG